VVLDVPLLDYQRSNILFLQKLSISFIRGEKMRRAIGDFHKVPKDIVILSAKTVDEF
jgi:hypothetical protein